MSTMITIEKQGSTLHFAGILDCHSLGSVWSRYAQFANIDSINVAKLTRVDSAGLALLTYLCIGYQATLVDVTLQLKTLTELYDLEPVVLSN
ncbi:phospholipid transport system transporter-binding protein [Orbus hercynius]|uniref:Phospholipid transport system transporter-binding protein n=1 Tax=Orbus hercynius TaxID=593135 RepID=A0A495RBR9_9GAMM|nr:anti-sigma B factor antagonist [Orbus hercynius]RKS84700.1 phospholipid transport system transporter-binding protein [Orbus hercynius]